jgi:predicted nuclease of predicted toxin-antitoxin system
VALVPRGVDVTRVSEITDPRSTDAAILDEARRRDAVIISHDQGFGALLAVGGAARPSVLNLRVSYVEPQRVAAAIEQCGSRREVHEARRARGVARRRGSRDARKDPRRSARRS